MSSLLLDIDGVLVRDKKLLNHVKENCVRYVRSKLPEAKDPAEVNRILYLAYGHTALGLHEAFQIDSFDFDEKVYDKDVMNHLADIIYADEFQREAVEIHEFTKQGWDVTLFTNSPEVWAKPIALAIGNKIKYKCPGILKPLAGAYTCFPRNQTHVYVDDSQKNLGTVRWLPNWNTVLFSEEPTEAPCPIIGSIWELSLYLESFKNQGSV